MFGTSCSYYPLYPPAAGVPLDFSLAKEALEISSTPDVLLLPSDLAPFVKVITSLWLEIHFIEKINVHIFEFWPSGRTLLKTVDSCMLFKWYWAHFVCRCSPLGKAAMIKNSLFAWTLGGWQRVLVGVHSWSFTTMRTPAGQMPPSSVYSFTGTAYQLTWTRGWFLCCGKCTKGLVLFATSASKDWSAQIYFCGKHCWWHVNFARKAISACHHLAHGGISVVTKYWLEDRHYCQLTTDLIISQFCRPIGYCISGTSRHADALCVMTDPYSFSLEWHFLWEISLFDIRR